MTTQREQDSVGPKRPIDALARYVESSNDQLHRKAGNGVSDFEHARGIGTS